MDYKSSGVDIDKADGLIKHVKSAASTTYDEHVLSGVGGFGALYELRSYREPVLVSATDGVGTKILLAKELSEYNGLGYDLVAMCVDDIVCAGAKPLFFIDYLALGSLNEKVYTTLIHSIASACKEAGCALIGGETAELPDMYPEDEFDMAGFSVGAVEKKDILKKGRVEKGDVVIGLKSSGTHSNGYSLIRKVLSTKKLDLYHDYGFGPLGEIALTPTRIYSKILVESVDTHRDAIHGIAHITGGGIPGNLNRILPDDLDALVDKKAWDIPEFFRFLQSEGDIAEDEAFRVLNMGIGMTVVCSPDSSNELINLYEKNGFEAALIGEIVKGSSQVNWK